MNFVDFMTIFIPPLFGYRKYKQGQLLEKDGNYKDACYKYAIAILNGSPTSSKRKRRIEYLWREYGPFDCSDVLEEAKKDDTPEHCEEVGHAVTMSIIEEVILPLHKKNKEGGPDNS